MAYTALVLAACILSARASNIPWWNIKLAQEQGPNVCVVEEVPNTKHHIWTECKYWKSREVCRTKPLIRYECCEGFKQVPGTQGCIGVKPFKNILETARNLGAGKFVNYIEKSGLAEELNAEGPFTLFAPLDEVFKDLPREQKAKFNSGTGDQLKPILQYHIVEGRLTSAQFKADLVIPTKYTGHKLRINKYSSRIETVNCALLQRRDQEASNGVVHIIGGLLDPSFTTERDLAELLVQDGRFQELTQAMDRSGQMEKLKGSDQPFTILAPSDEAFTKIRPSRLSKILNDKQALKELLENHLLPHVICTPAIIDEHKVHTYGTNKITLDCDKKGVKIKNNYMQADFTMGANGVIYLINTVLVPDRAKSIIQILEEKNLQSFLQLIHFAGLEDAFENFGEYTLFVPSEAAMFSLSQETVRTLKTNKDKARRFVLFHATQGRHKTDRMNNNQVIMSLDEQNLLRIQLYRGGGNKSTGPRSIAAVEGATIQKADHDCLNGVVHIINKVLFSTNTTAGEFLRQNGSFKIFLSAMEKVTSANPELVDFNKPKTFFAPTDEAFQKLGDLQLQQMLEDPVYLNKTVRNHMSEGMMISESIQPDLKYSVPSLLNTLVVSQEDGKIRINDAVATECDILTKNGMVHIIDNVLLPDKNFEV